MKRAVMRMVRSKLAAAMSTWREMAAESKRAAHMSGGAIRRMLNRKLSMAFETWQSTAAQMAAEASGQLALRSNIANFVLPPFS